MSYKTSKASLNNTKYFLPTSVEYEQDVYSVTITQDNNLTDQQNYSYGLRNQEDIYQYRYDQFLKGNRDADITPIAYSEIELPPDKVLSTQVSTKSKPVHSHIFEHYKELRIGQGKEKEKVVEESGTCGFEEDGVTSACGKGKNLYNIMDPRFNLREAAKNCILLEDHLTHSGKQCSDCIKKHILMIEGFLEEGLTLDKEKKHKQEFDKCIKEFRTIFKRLASKLNDETLQDEECCQFAQEIRAFRKPLCQKYATFF